MVRPLAPWKRTAIQPAISKHVSHLKMAELVRETRKEQWVFYLIKEKRLEEIGYALSHLPDLSEELRKLEQHGLTVTCEQRGVQQVSKQERKQLSFLDRYLTYGFLL